MNFKLTDIKKWLIWIFATLAIIIIYQISYGFATLQPSNISWLMTVRHDWGTHYLGWAFYRTEPWHFPLGKVTGYNYPAGTNVGFTDSIPLLAIIFKLFAPWLSGDFQYFGIWLFLCHLLAGYYTILLFRLFKVNWVITLAGVIFIVSNPVLAYRGMHPALCGHWILIACIYFYFLNIKTTHWRKILLYQFILLIFSSVINPYLCWMALGFSFATPFRLWFYDKLISWKYLISYLLISLFSVWLLWFMTGMISFSRKEGLWINGSYGLYGMNLNSLYNPGGYSSILPQLKWVSWHQYEGFMYLGAGMLFLILILFLYYGFNFVTRKLNRNESATSLSANQIKLRPLLVLIILYAIFSITLVFTFNDKVLFRIPAPGFFKQLEEIFRASARFFWMPYYVIILFSIISLAKAKLNHVITSCLIVLGLVIQLYDINRLLTGRDLSYGTYKPPMDNEDWIYLMRQFDEVLFFPAFTSPGIRSMDYQDFSYLALKAGKPVNLAYVAREDTRAMQRFSDSLTRVVQSGILSPHALYITNAENLKYFSLAFQMETAWMSSLDGCYYIVSNTAKNDQLDSFANKLNALKKAKLDRAKIKAGNRNEFSESTKLPESGLNSIRYNLESDSIGQQVIKAQGWAFIENSQNNKGDSVFFTLNSQERFYMASASLFKRPDITSGFKGQYLDDAGFVFLAFTDNVETGKYELGLAIKNAKGQFIYQPIGEKVIIKNNE
ncbi:MAG TPA: DUF6311 domain-containing protein [Puia sp.]|nr:DUF6311 domain-containing protein [Puia sp.]